jgi:hypothetical protein
MPFRKFLVPWALLFALAASFTSLAQQANLSAAEVVNRNVAARGGLQNWRAVKTVSLSGKMQAGGNNRPSVAVPGQKRGAKVAPQSPAEQVELPFRMELKRTRKLRLEIDFNGQTSVQVYDGSNGWKMRPFLNRTDYEPYTADETKSASEQSDLDGPLVDYAAKGSTVELAGREKVGNRDNYKIKLTLKNGYSFHVWIDAQTFLESKIEGTPRRLDGELRPVEIYLRDYRPVNGLQFPHQYETKVNSSVMKSGKRFPQVMTEAMTIDKIEVNPPLDDALFTRPKASPDTKTAKAVSPSTKPRQQ